MQCGPEITIFTCQIGSGQCQGQGEGQSTTSVLDVIFLLLIGVVTSAGVLVEQPKKAISDGCSTVVLFIRDGWRHQNG